MSISDYLNDGADYADIYDVDCDGECEDCVLAYECEHSDVLDRF